MSPANIFTLQLILGYVPWLFCFCAYLWPRLKVMKPTDAQRVIATLHAFRFFGLVFIIPGVVGSSLPAGFAEPAAWGDFATGLLAIVALMAIRIRPLFWLLVATFNVVGTADIFVDYFHGSRVHLPELAGQLGAAYMIPIIFVPILLITHFAAFRLMLGSRRSKTRAANPVAGSRG